MSLRIFLSKLRACLEQRKRRIAMALCDGVMQSRLPVGVCGVEWALLGYQEVDHGYGANGGRSVKGVLAALVAYAGGGGGLVGKEEAGNVDVVFGGDEMEDSL